MKWNPGLGEDINLWNDMWVGEKLIRNFFIGPLTKEDDKKTLNSLITNNIILENFIPTYLPNELKLVIKDMSFPNEQDSLFSSWTNPRFFSKKP